MEKLTYDAWLAKVDARLQREHNITTVGYPELPLRDWYRSDKSTVWAAHQVFAWFLSRQPAPTGLALEKVVHTALDNSVLNGFNEAGPYNVEHMSIDLATYDADCEKVELKDLEPHVRSWVAKREAKS